MGNNENADKILGWGVYKPERKDVGKIISWEGGIAGGRGIAGQKCGEQRGIEIIELKDGRRVYCITSFPELTAQEAGFVADVRERFMESNSKGKRKSLKEVMKGYCSEQLIELEKEQESYLFGVASSLVFEFGPMSRLLEQDGIEEIAVIGLGRKKPVYVYERKLGWLETNLYFADSGSVKNLINRMSRNIGRRISMQTPKINAVLPDGSRINATIEPVSFSGPSLTIRKFRQKPFTPVDLMDEGTISAEALGFLWLTLQTDCSMLICGNTGSGKTTTLNALFSFVPEDERIIITEETPEINLPHRHIVKLNTADNLAIDMHSLITDTLRMRPDRIVVGEVRNSEETNAFIDTLLAGQGKGSYATFHAQSAREAVVRMQKLGVMAMDVASIDLIVVQRRWTAIRQGGRREMRRVVEISEVLEEGKLNTLYKYNYAKDFLERVGGSIRIREKVMNCLGVPARQFESEVMGKAKELRKLSGKGMQIAEFFEYANGLGMETNSSRERRK